MCIKVSITINIFASLYIDELLKQGLGKETNFIIDSRVTVKISMNFRYQIHQKTLENIDFFNLFENVFRVI